MSICGVSVVVMDTWSKGGSKYYQYTLNKGLWKFDTDESIQCRNFEKVWSWRKLSVAGVMIACVFVAVFNRVISLFLLAAISVGFYFVWILSLLFYWYFVVVSSKNKIVNQMKSEVDDKNTSGWQCRLKDNEQDRRLPVTIVTGYLGSGKTTLVKSLLSNTLGMKILVIENEIGTEGIDHDLLLQHTAKEEIILMNNGCICCTGNTACFYNFVLISQFVQCAVTSLKPFTASSQKSPSPN